MSFKTYVVAALLLIGSTTAQSSVTVSQVGAFKTLGYVSEVDRLLIHNPGLTFSVIAKNGVNKIVTATKCEDIKLASGCFRINIGYKK